MPITTAMTGAATTAAIMVSSVSPEQCSGVRMVDVTSVSNAKRNNEPREAAPRPPLFLVRSEAGDEVISPKSPFWIWCTAHPKWPSFSFPAVHYRSEEHTSELQSQFHLVCR